MTIMFISDIHGIKTNLKIIKEKWDFFHCDKLVVLGDLYYMGDRSRIDEYDQEYVEKFLSSFKDRLICLRGNCDSKRDIEYSDFPIIEDSSLLMVDNMELYLTHGHIHNETNWKKENTILIYGHYHIPFIKEIGTNLYINPGSISLPKDNFNPTYLIYKNKEFKIYDIYDNEIANKMMK